MNSKVSFIGIGSGKSGSSWLWENIIAHPEISSYNAKEINYFSSLYNKSLEWYYNQFDNCQKVKGEFSVTYIDNNLSAKRIYDFNKDIKIICILRNPINRIISDYYHSIRRGKLSSSTKLIDYVKNPENIKYGFYKNKLNRYFKYFSEDNILIIEMENCMKNKIDYISKVYNFLNLNDTKFVPDNIEVIVNKGFVPKIKFIENTITFISQFLTKVGAIRFLEFLKKIKLHSLIRKINSDFNLPKIDSESKEYLNNIFKDEIFYFKNEYKFKNW